MLTFRKKPKLEFVCMIEGIDELYPIIPTHLAKKRWVPNSTRVHKCPAISKIITTGYVQTAWMDIVIRTGSGGDVEFTTPLDPREMVKDASVSSYVGWHENEYSKLIGDASALENVVKIQSPWNAYVPVGYSLIVLPEAYSDLKPYRAAQGIIKGTGEMTQLAVQLLTNQGQEFKIKAGEPLCQYILVKDEAVDVDVRSATTSDFLNYRKGYIMSRNKFKS